MVFPVSLYSMHLYGLIIPYNSSLIVCWLLRGQIFIIPVYALISYYIVLQYIAITLGGFTSSDDCFVQNDLFVHWQCISFKFRSLDQLFFLHSNIMHSWYTFTDYAYIKYDLFNLSLVLFCTNNTLCPFCVCKCRMTTNVIMFDIHVSN